MQGLGTHRHVLQEAKRHDVHDFVGTAPSRCSGSLNRVASYGANCKTERAGEGREEGGSQLRILIFQQAYTVFKERVFSA